MAQDDHDLMAYLAKRFQDSTRMQIGFYEAARKGDFTERGIDENRLLQMAEKGVRGAEAMEQLLATTIKPYLDRDDEMGTNARRQLRLLAVEHSHRRDFRLSWRL